MSCGCGCNGAPSGCGKGLNMQHGIMLAGSRGVPKPLTAGFAAGLPNIALGLGDIWTDSGMTDPTTVVSPSDYSYTPSYTPAATGNSSGALNLLSNLAASWSGAAQQILKSNAGALPTYQQVTPNGSVTVYGNTSNLPTSLQTSLLSATTGSGGLLLLGGAALLIVMMMSKR